MMTKISLPCYGIVVVFEASGFGTIESKLFSHVKKHPECGRAVNAIESMILTHATAGINIASPAYIEGIEEAVDAVLDPQ